MIEVNDFLHILKMIKLIDNFDLKGCCMDLEMNEFHFDRDYDL